MSIFPPDSQFKYFTKIEIEAAQWTGKNLDEMKKLLAPYISRGVFYDDIPAFMNFPAYRLLKFHCWGEYQQLTPGEWVVIYSDGEGEIMEDEQFEKMGFRR